MTSPLEIYANQTPPLLPSEADLAAHESSLRIGDAPLEVLMLGVTPGTYRLPWPTGSAVHAVDRSLPMVEQVWPGPAGDAHVGEWTQLPFRDAQFDRVVCDGGMAFFGPSSIESVRAEIARVLRPGGLFVVRVYVWDRDESLDRVIDDVLQGAVSTASEMRIRTWSALQTSFDLGVTVGDAFDAVVTRLGSVEHLIELSGLDAHEFVPFIASATSTMRYTMWPADELIGAWTRADDFELTGVTVPAHHLGALVPVLAFSRRACSASPPPDRPPASRR